MEDSKRRVEQGGTNVEQGGTDAEHGGTSQLPVRPAELSIRAC